MAEPLRATFFTLRRRDRSVLLPATLTLIAILALLLAALLGLNWHGFTLLGQMFTQAGHGAAPDQQTSMAMVGSMFGLIGTVLLFLFPIYIAVAMYEAACLRWMLRQEVPGFFGFSFNKDTWRVYGTYWVWAIGQYVVSFAMSLLMLPIMFAFMGNVMSGAKPDPDAIWQFQLMVQLPLTFLQYIPMIFLGVRFGPAAATSVARKEFSPFKAWDVTRGRFWSLLGSFALIWLIAAVLMTLASAPIIARLWPLIWQASQTHDPATSYNVFAQFFSAENLTWVAFTYLAWGVIGAGVGLMFYGINSCAVLAAAEDGKIELPGVHVADHFT